MVDADQAGDAASRRRFLAVAAAVLSAGCSVNNGDGGESTPSTTAPTTAPPVGGSAELHIEGNETAWERTDRTATEDRGGESTTRGAERALSAAKRDLRAAVDAYTSPRGVGSVVDVTAATTGFDPEPVDEHVAAARDHLDAAAGAPDADGDAIDACRRFATVLEDLVACQVAVRAAYDHLQVARTHLYAEEFGAAFSALAAVESSARDAADRRDALESETDPDDAEAIGAISTDAYALKVDQFGAEIEGFRTVRELYGDERDALRTLANGVDSYVTGNYDGAQIDVFDAQSAFEDLHNRLGDVDVAPSLATAVRGLTDATAALESGAAKLLESCRHGRNGEDRAREQSLVEARNEFNGDGRVADLPSARQLADA
ncbi:MAG: hypothetical protein ABEJ31_12525 [Haloarculaceae archaeon]